MGDAGNRSIAKREAFQYAPLDTGHRMGP
jgi:hypothetical protein